MAGIKRTPPNNFEAEKSVLGAILIDANSFYIVSGLLTPKDFYYRETRAIYETLISMEHEKKPLDVISVISELKAKKRIQEAGGASFLPCPHDPGYVEKAPHHHRRRVPAERSV